MGLDRIQTYDFTLNECLIKIGGEFDKFLPNINMSKWDDEAWLNINCPVPFVNEEETFVDGKIELVVGNERHSFFEINNKLEYEIAYASRPLDKVEFDLTLSENLTFCKQKTLYEDWQDEQVANPENPNNLTWAEYLVAAHRPENVLDSFAIYHNKKNNKYKSGKWGHIYRIGLRDADNNVVWTESEIIPVDGTHAKLLVAMPVKFLDEARYPVILDPILGYDTAGSSDWGYNNITDGVSWPTDGSGGIINSYHCAIESIDTNPGVKMGCYNCAQGDGDPDSAALVEAYVEFDVSVIDDNSQAGGGTNLAASTKYHIAWIPEESGTDVKYDTDVGIEGFYRTGQTYADELVSPYDNGSTSHTRKYSIWLDYGGAVIAPTGTIYGPLYGPFRGVL